MTIISMEDIFKAGWNAYHDHLHNGNVADTPEDAYTSYRYKILKETEGLDSANEWAEQRKKSQQAKPENLRCPDCDGPMTPRSSIHGKFWGCKSYPKCKGTRDVNGLSKSERNTNRSDHEDVGPDSYSPQVMTTFRKS